MIAKPAGGDQHHLPYANMGQATANVVAGEVPAYVSFYSQVAGQLKSGALLPIAVASAARTSVLPDVPTTVELGYPDATVEPWAGFFAPAGMRPELVAMLGREFNAIAQLPEVRERFAQLGMDPLSSTPERFAAEMRAQVARWPAIVKAAGIKRE
jgi:tripartite-type tricarboxylate transporter receptor subunit TctC